MAKYNAKINFQSEAQAYVEAYITRLVKDSDTVETFINNLHKSYIGKTIVRGFYKKYPQLTHYSSIVSKHPMQKEYPWFQELKDEQIKGIGLVVKDLKPDPMRDSFHAAKQGNMQDFLQNPHSGTPAIITIITHNTTPISINKWLCAVSPSFEERQREEQRFINVLKHRWLCSHRIQYICDAVKKIDPIVVAAPEKIIEIIDLLREDSNPEQFVNAVKQIGEEQRTIIKQFMESEIGASYYQDNPLKKQEQLGRIQRAGGEFIINMCVESALEALDNAIKGVPYPPTHEPVRPPCEIESTRNTDDKKGIIDSTKNSFKSLGNLRRAFTDTGLPLLKGFAPSLKKKAAEKKEGSKDREETSFSSIPADDNEKDTPGTGAVTCNPLHALPGAILPPQSYTPCNHTESAAAYGIIDISKGIGLIRDTDEDTDEGSNATAKGQPKRQPPPAPKRI